jgi:hypothetical protein
LVQPTPAARMPKDMHLHSHVFDEKSAELAM